jgi:hypothetical protein
MWIRQHSKMNRLWFAFGYWGGSEGEEIPMIVGWMRLEALSVSCDVNGIFLFEARDRLRLARPPFRQASASGKRKVPHGESQKKARNVLRELTSPRLPR